MYTINILKSHDNASVYFSIVDHYKKEMMEHMNLICVSQILWELESKYFRFKTRKPLLKVTEFTKTLKENTHVL